MIGTDRFWSKVTKSDGCWEWTGGRSDGYGSLWWDGRSMRVHRVSWLLLTGALPEPPLELDHLCRNRACVNPAHLEAVTPDENKRRGDHSRHGIRQREQTECIHGHPYTEQNTMRQKGRDGYWSRICRTCYNLRRQSRRRRRREAGLVR